MKVVINCPKGVCGAMSPKPTVVNVTIHQYTLFGMLSKPLTSPSTRYIIVPKIIEETITANRKTRILTLLAIMESFN